MPPQADSPKDYEPEFQPPRYPYVGHKKAGHKTLFIIIGSVIALLLVAGVAFWALVLHSKPAPVKTATTTTTQTQTPALDPAVASTTQTFKSAKLNIQVTYRKDWTLAESSNKAEMTLTSPSTTYTKSDGSSASGVFTMKIREDVPDAMQTTIQKSVTSSDSTVIAYAQFTPSQRQYTNLSFAGAKADAFNFFMVTGDQSYKTGTPFGTGIDYTGTTYLIAGCYGNDSTDALAFDSLPKASAESTVYSQALDIVKNLQIY